MDTTTQETIYVRWMSHGTATENHILRSTEFTFKRWRGDMLTTRCGKEFAVEDRLYRGSKPQELGGRFNNNVCPRCIAALAKLEAK